MLIKVFVDWREEKILSEFEYNEKIQQMIEMIEDDDDLFNDWLNERYSAYLILKMTEEEKDMIQKSWEEECRIDAINNSNFEEVEIEI